MIGSSFRLPCIDMPRIDMPRIDMPRIDMPRLGSTCRFHIFHCHLTYITLRAGPHTTYPLTITHYTEHAIPSSQFKYSRVIFQNTLDEALIDTSL
jgi:hypothetical protein